MKKNNFINGAMIATFGIILSKIIGIIYVIPFYSIIGEQGGALYGYAYNIYSIFLTISVVGIPLAMSRLVSEYITKDNYYTKERIYKLGLIVVNLMGIISFIILLFLSRIIAEGIVGGTVGGNSVDDVTFVLRIVSIGILIVPTLSVTRGYLQGHNFISETSISQVIEQIVRVIVILAGSYLATYILGLPLVYSVGIALFGAIIGSLVSYLYLYIKMKKNRDKLDKDHFITREEKNNTDKILIKKIISYALPFIVIDVVKDSYNLVDSLVVVKTMVNDLGYSMIEAETVMSVISTWGSKLNMIVIAISSGLIVSLLPNISSSFIKKDINSLNEQINQTYQILLYISLPIVISISIFSDVVWNFFYGFDILSINVYSYYIWSSLILIFFTVSISILQCFNSYKIVFVSLIIGFLTNAFCNIPFMQLFYDLGYDSFYGNITATMFGYFLSMIICMYFLIYKYKINLNKTFNTFLRLISAGLVYSLILLSLNLIFKVSIDNKILSIIHVSFYTLIALVVYVLLTYKQIGELYLKKAYMFIKNKKNRN